VVTDRRAARFNLAACACFFDSATSGAPFFANAAAAVAAATATRCASMAAARAATVPAARRATVRLRAA